MFQPVGALSPSLRSPAAPRSGRGGGITPSLSSPSTMRSWASYGNIALVEFGPEIRNEAGRHFLEDGQLGLAALDHAVLRVDDGGHRVEERQPAHVGLLDLPESRLIVALHVGGDREDAAIEAGVAGIPRQGLLEQRPAFLGSPGETLQLPDLAEQLGIVGVERQRPVADLEGLVELVVEEERRGQGLKRPDILRIEADGGARCGERAFRRRLLAFGEAGTDLVDIDVGEQRPGRRVFGKARHRVLEAGLDLRIALGRDRGAVDVVAQRAEIGVEVVRGRLRLALRLGLEDDPVGLRDRRRHLAGGLCRQREQIVGIDGVLIGARPQHRPGLAARHPHADAHDVRVGAHAPLEHVLDARDHRSASPCPGRAAANGTSGRQAPLFP